MVVHRGKSHVLVSHGVSVRGAALVLLIHCVLAASAHSTKFVVRSFVFFSPPTSRLYVVFYAILVGGLSDDLMLMVCPWIPTLAPAHRKEMMRAAAHARTRASSLVPARWHLRVCVCY